MGQKAAYKTHKIYRKEKENCQLKKKTSMHKVHGVEG